MRLWPDCDSRVDLYFPSSQEGLQPSVSAPCGWLPKLSSRAQISSAGRKQWSRWMTSALGWACDCVSYLFSLSTNSDAHIAPRLVREVSDSVMPPLLTGWFSRRRMLVCRWRCHLFSTCPISYHPLVDFGRWRRFHCFHFILRVPAASDGKPLVSEERIKSPRRKSSTTAPSARRKTCQFE